MVDKLESYRYLWEDESGRYILIQSIESSNDYKSCLVYDLETKTGLLEEDENVYQEIQKRLAEKGVAMLPTVPK